MIMIRIKIGWNIRIANQSSPRGHIEEDTRRTRGQFPFQNNIDELIAR